MFELADGARVDECRRARPLRVMGDHESLGNKFAGLVAGLDQLVDFLSFERVFDMRVVGERDVDGLHLRIGQQGVITVMYAQPRHHA